VHVDGVFAGDNILDGAAADLAGGLVCLGGVRHGDGIDGISICRVSVVAGVQTGNARLRRIWWCVRPLEPRVSIRLVSIRLANTGVADHNSRDDGRVWLACRVHPPIINQSVRSPTPPHFRYTILLRHTHLFYAPCERPLVDYAPRHSAELAHIPPADSAQGSKDTPHQRDQQCLLPALNSLP
jgi:hypothetical protein